MSTDTGLVLGAAGTSTEPATAPEPPIDASAAVARVRRYYELVDSGDTDGLVALFAPDAVYHRPGYEPIIGHLGLTRFYTGERVIREGRHDLSTIVAHDREVAVHGEFNGVLHDGREVSLRFCDFFVLGPDESFTRRDTFFFAPMV